MLLIMDGQMGPPQQRLPVEHTTPRTNNEGLWSSSLPLLSLSWEMHRASCSEDGDADDDGYGADADEQQASSL